jgi:hypothetical protein
MAGAVDARMPKCTHISTHSRCFRDEACTQDADWEEKQMTKWWTSAFFSQAVHEAFQMFAICYYNSLVSYVTSPPIVDLATFTFRIPHDEKAVRLGIKTREKIDVASQTFPEIMIDFHHASDSLGWRTGPQSRPFLCDGTTTSACTVYLEQRSTAQG